MITIAIFAVFLLSYFIEKLLILLFLWKSNELDLDLLRDADRFITHYFNWNCTHTEIIKHAFELRLANFR